MAMERCAFDGCGSVGGCTVGGNGVGYAGYCPRHTLLIELFGYLKALGMERGYECPVCRLRVMDMPEDCKDCLMDACGACRSCKRCCASSLKACEAELASLGEIAAQCRRTRDRLGGVVECAARRVA